MRMTSQTVADMQHETQAATAATGGPHAHASGTLVRRVRRGATGALLLAAGAAAWWWLATHHFGGQDQAPEAAAGVAARPADVVILPPGDAAARIVVPFNATSGVHPEYDGYVFGTKVKQADTILLGFPLAFSHPTFTPATLANDLAAYGNCTDAGGPAMTWGMFAVGYIQLGPAYALLAASNFNRSFANAQVSMVFHRPHPCTMHPRCFLMRRNPSMCGPRRRRAARPTS
jgi:hypothetical protein